MGLGGGGRSESIYSKQQTNKQQYYNHAPMFMRVDDLSFGRNFINRWSPGAIIMVIMPIIMIIMPTIMPIIIIYRISCSDFETQYM